MRAAITKTEIETEIASRFGAAFKRQEKLPGEFLSSGVAEVDSFIGGLPRGAITEIYGPASSGRTSLMLSAMAHATSHEEVCALVDINNTFDPKSAAQAEVKLDRLLWIRCAQNLEHAFKATDLLLQAGGFGLVTLDLGDVPGKAARRIISSWWYRFRRTLENTSTVLVVIAEESAAKSCASLSLDLKAENQLWSSTNELRREVPAIKKVVSAVTAVSAINFRRPSPQVAYPHTNLLRGLVFQAECRRPLHLKREALCKARLG